MAFGLPTELEGVILEQITSKADLCRIARVCRSLCQEAERLIFRNVEIEKLLDFIRFARLIKTSPRLGGYIYSFTAWISSSSLLHYFVPTFAKLVNGAMTQMPHLRHLALNIYLPVPNPSDSELLQEVFSCAGMFDRCTFRLRSFSCRFEYDDHLCSLLHEQSEIRRFEYSVSIHNFGPSGTLGWDHLLPRLRVLETDDLETIRRFAAHRPVTHLGYTRAFPMSEELVRSLSLSSGPIKALNLLYTPPSIVAVDALARVLPTLEQLITSTFSQYQIDLITHAVKTFGYLQELQINEFPGMAPVSQIGEGFLDAWFNIRPSLRVVQIMTMRNGQPTVKSQWIRDGKSFKKASWAAADGTLWEDSVARVLA